MSDFDGQRTWGLVLQLDLLFPIDSEDVLGIIFDPFMECWCPFE